MWRHYAYGALTFLHDLVVSRPERVALRDFRLNNPDIDHTWSSRICEDGDRFVVCIFYGECRPAQYRFYAVSRDYRQVQELSDDSEYRPKGWR